MRNRRADNTGTPGGSEVFSFPRAWWLATCLEAAPARATASKASRLKGNRGSDGAQSTRRQRVRRRRPIRQPNLLQGGEA